MLHHTFPALVEVSALGAMGDPEYDEEEWENIPRRLRLLQSYHN
jgi:hypothetical protein